MLLLLIPKFDCPLLIVIGIRMAPFDLDQRARARRIGLLQRICGLQWRAAADEDGHYWFAVPL